MSLNFDLTDEHTMFRETIASFADKEIAPLVEEAEAKEEFPYFLFKRLGELGFLCCRYPEEYGGAGADKISECLYMEELNRVCSGIASCLLAHGTLATTPLYDFGTEEQKQEYLIPAIRGDKIGAFALTEPNAGSDAASILSRAVKEGSHYVLNGTKTFITNGSLCDYVLVAAYTDPSKRGRGISLFIVDRDTPGFSVARRLEKAGLRSADTAELAFEDCMVPENRLLGEKEGGFMQVVKTLVGGRISYGGRCSGVARGAFDVTTRYMKDRVQFGRPLIKFQVNQFKIAEWAMYIDIMHTITWKAAWMYDLGRDCTKEASIVKLFCSEMTQRIVNEAIQMFGGYGFMMEYPIQRIWRDSRVLTITEGVSEVHHAIIFDQLDLLG